MKIWNKKVVLNNISTLKNDASYYKEVEKNIFASETKPLIKTQQDKPLISAHDITKTFIFSDAGKLSKFTSLNNISFSIDQGNVLFLMGSNGSGKSTLINCLCNIYKPNSGSFDYNYQYISSPYEKLAVAFQINKYLEVMKVWDYIVLTQRLYKSKISESYVAFLLYLFGLDPFINKKAHKLSGGIQQRLNLVLALLSESPILIFDEITNNLDQNTREKILDFIKKFLKIRNITSIIVSHDSFEVEKLATHILILKEGNVVYNQTFAKAVKQHKNIHNLIEKFK